MPILAYNGSMKTTIDIPDQELTEVIRLTGARTKREAVVIAISEFNRRKRLESLADSLGTFESLLTPQELRKLREAR